MKGIAAFIAAAGIAVAANAQVVINEVQPNPAGLDPLTNFVELRGTAGTSFSGFLINIDTDGPQTGTAFLFVNPTGSIAVNGTFDSNGLLTVSIPDFENPSFGLLLVSNSVAAGTDLDSDNNGQIDNVSIFGTIFDAFITSDQVEDVTLSANIATQLGAVNLGFSGLTGNSAEPLSVFRDGITGDFFQVVLNSALGSSPVIADASGAFVTAPFFINGVQVDATQLTFGGVNPSLVPAPGSLALLGLGGLVAGRRRR